MEFLLMLLAAFFLWKLAFPGNKKEKKTGCFAKLFKGIITAFAVLVVLTLLSSTSDDTASSTVPVTSPTSIPVEETIPPLIETTPIPTAELTAEPTLEPTAEPTLEPTAEPSTLQEWAEYVAQSVYGRFDYAYTNLISVSCEQVDGENAPMVTINVKYPDSFMRDNDERMSSFLFNAMNVTWKLADLAKEGKIEYESVFIHGKAAFIDNYGNETEGDAAQIRIKSGEAAKVNWSYSTFTGDMLPGISVSFGIHPVIREGLSSEYYNSIRK